MFKEFSDREKTIAAAAYLQGLILGLAAGRGLRWLKRMTRSELATSSAFRAVHEILTDGCASNPLLIYEMRELAERWGLFTPTAEAGEVIASNLQSNSEASKCPAK